MPQNSEEDHPKPTFSEKLFSKVKLANSSKLGWSGGKWFKEKDRTQWSSDSTAIRILFAGGMAGAIAKSAVAPLERIKLLCQVHPMDASNKPRTIISTFREIWRTDGILGFWAGNGANVIRIIPNKAVLFMCNDIFVKAFTSADTNELTVARRFFAGCLSGATCAIATYPLDLVRTRLACQSKKHPIYKGIIDCMHKVFAQEGIAGLYRGIGPTVIGIMPYAGISFTSFEIIKGMSILPVDEQGKVTVVGKLFSGAISGIISQSVTYPLDTVRRRMQMNTARVTTSDVGGPVVQQGPLYRNMLDCFQKIIKYEGIGALFRGFFANVLRAGPNVAIQFASYEYIKKILNVA